MNQKTSSRMTLLALGLAILLGAWGCKNADKKGEATPGSGAAGTAASGTPGQAAAPGATPAPVAESTPITPDKMPDVVAKVNGQAIKKDDLVKGAQVVRMKMAQMGQPVALTGTFYHQVLDELIGITLLQQQAKAAGIAPSEAEVNQQVAARKSSFPSEEVYKQALQQTGLTEDLLRKQTRDQMAVQKYVETKVVANIAVTDQAAKDFYEKNKAEIHSRSGSTCATSCSGSTPRRPPPPTSRRPRPRPTTSSSRSRAAPTSPSSPRRARRTRAPRSRAATSAGWCWGSRPCRPPSRRPPRPSPSPTRSARWWRAPSATTSSSSWSARPRPRCPTTR